MHPAIVQNWWSVALRGIAAMLFGILTFIWPGLTLETLVLLFAIYAVFDGVLSLIGAARASSHHQRWGALLFEGIVGIAAGVAAFIWPAITLVLLATLVGVWAFLTGVLELVAAWELRHHIGGEWLLALTGVASVVFGILVTIAPLAGAFVLAMWLGAYALIFGIVMVALSVRLRSHHTGHLGGHHAAPVSL